MDKKLVSGICYTQYKLVEMSSLELLHFEFSMSKIGNCNGIYLKSIFLRQKKLFHFQFYLKVPKDTDCLMDKGIVFQISVILFLVE